ncbi:hypothetical protein BDB00DRAFT_879744 [Zychaea mexicana]|uniref:uncharacterized protein n=1 Tax=Zychaea mexicana TaxID=64656 RepID=UPI0022FE07CF|nr:uncharacterized protein BDB00DRAFT_879744 [Zychaea mexicana]KAI9474331.1 hypothetical protein BDB00DRAFT_879744 [Zychaea mexicana]
MAYELLFNGKGHERIMPIVVKSQPILEHLRIVACGLSDIHCWDVLARNQFTQLTSLGLTDITGMSSEDWSQILLMQQQNEILEVGNRAGITQYLNTIIATIGTLQRLRILSLRNFLHMFSENPLCDLTPLRRLQQLEKMRLTNIPIDNQEAGWIVWAQRLEETKILNLELTAVKGVTGAVLKHFEQVESSVLLRVSRIYSLTNAGINAFRIIEGSSKKIEVMGCSGLSRTDDLHPGLMERQHDVDLVGSESGALSNLSESTD